MKNSKEIYILLISLLLIIIAVFPSEAKISANIAQAKIQPTAQVAPNAYCETPQLLARGYVPQIDNRTVIYRVLNGTTKLQIYDLGQDNKKSNDDLGAFNLIPSINGLGEESFSIYKDKVVYHSYNTTSFRRIIKIISSGNDKIFGTNDDVGPTQILTTPDIPTYIIRKIAVDKNSVSFEVFNGPNSSTYYSCISDIQQGNCWTQNPSQISTSSINIKDNILSTQGINGQYFLWSETNSQDSNIYFKDNLQEGVFYNSSESELLEDVSDLFLVYSQKSNSFPRYSKIGFGLVNFPGLKMNLSREGNYYDSGARISHTPGKNGEIFISWVRTYPNNQKKYFVSSLNSGVEIEVPFSQIYSTGTPYVDDNTLVFESNGNIFITECYYSP